MQEAKRPKFLKVFKFSAKLKPTQDTLSCPPAHAVMEELEFPRKLPERVPKYLRDDHPKGRWLITFDERTALKASDAMLEDLVKGRVERRPRRTARKRRKAGKRKRGRSRGNGKEGEDSSSINVGVKQQSQHDSTRKLEAALQRHNTLLQVRMSQRLGETVDGQKLQLDGDQGQEKSGHGGKSKRVRKEEEEGKEECEPVTIAAVISECQRFRAVRPRTSQPRMPRPRGGHARVVRRPGTVGSFACRKSGKGGSGAKRGHKGNGKRRLTSSGESRRLVTAPSPAGKATPRGRRSSASRLTWLENRGAAAGRPSTYQGPRQITNRLTGTAMQKPQQPRPKTAAAPSSPLRQRRRDIDDEDDGSNRLAS